MPQRPRLYDFRASGGPEAIGLCATDITSIMAAVNEAQERLANDSLCPEDGWYGTWAKMLFNVSRSEPTIVLPQEVARVILLDVCKRPVPIQNEFYEYLTFGTGLHPKRCSSVISNPCEGLTAFERENVPTFEPLLSTPQTIRCYLQDSRDVGRTSLVQGEDANGSPILFIDPATGNAGSGETITFSQPFVDTTNTFSVITGVQKQKTFGECQYYQVGSDGSESPLLVMSPGEMTASYRKMFINGLPNSCCVGCVPSTSLQVSALCKLDFTPVSSDSDYLFIRSIPALIDMCMSVRMARVDSFSAQQLSEKKHASAIRLLFGQLTNYMGVERPAIGRHIFGSQPLRLNPI